TAHACEQESSVTTEINEELAEIGVLNLELTESNGGLELPIVTQAQIMTALSFGDLGTDQGLRGANDAASLARTTEHEQRQNKLNGEQTTAFLDVSNGDVSLGDQLQISKQSNGYSMNGVSHPVRNAQVAENIIVAGKDVDGEAVVLFLDQQAG